MIYRGVCGAELTREVERGRERQVHSYKEIHIYIERERCGAIQRRMDRYPSRCDAIYRGIEIDLHIHRRRSVNLLWKDFDSSPFRTPRHRVFRWNASQSTLLALSSSFNRIGVSFLLFLSLFRLPLTLFLRCFPSFLL